MEVATLLAGVALLGFFAAARLDSYFASRAAIANFEAAATHPAPPALATSARPSRVRLAPGSVDFSLWSAGRVRAYKRSLARDPDSALAILRIPKIHLTVPVFNGTGAMDLNRGVGRIAGTAFPGEPGNLGIAGHRDGFFRGLKDVSRGDALELEQRGGETAIYVVDKIEIVGPGDLAVLAPRQAPALTLVTCYPFYFLGDAPKRYVVEASLRGAAPSKDQRSLPSRLGAAQGETRK